MPKNNSKAQREYRAKSAAERQAKYDALTRDEKVAKMHAHQDATGGLTLRQSRRFLAERDAA